jgi:hypothetical protein
MATLTLVDYRRRDLRSNVRWNPYWISSLEISWRDLSASTKGCIVASFPATSGTVIIQSCVVQVITEFSSDSTNPDILVGNGTIATDLTTSGTLTIVDQLSCVSTGEVTTDTIGKYIGTFTPFLLEGADATVPVIFVSNAGAATAGALRVHLEVAKVPAP